MTGRSRGFLGQGSVVKSHRGAAAVIGDDPRVSVEDRSGLTPLSRMDGKARGEDDPRARRPAFHNADRISTSVTLRARGQGSPVRECFRFFARKDFFNGLQSSAHHLAPVLPG